MSADVITDVEITDAGLYRQFLEQVAATVENHGGRFVVRGGGIDVIEDDWTPKRIAILVFDSVNGRRSSRVLRNMPALNDIRTRASSITC